MRLQNCNAANGVIATLTPVIDMSRTVKKAKKAKRPSLQTLRLQCKQVKNVEASMNSRTTRKIQRFTNMIKLPFTFPKQSLENTQNRYCAII